MRSMLRNVVKQHGIEEFYRDPINIIRDAILGKSTEGGRTGRKFDENCMRIYEVDVLGVSIKDEAICGLLEKAQTDALRTTLEIAAKERELNKTTRIEAFEREISKEKAATTSAKVGIEVEQIKMQLEKNLAELKSKFESERKKQGAELAQQAGLDTISAARLARGKAEEDQNMALAAERIRQELDKKRQETEEIVKRAVAVSDKLIAALQAFGDDALMAKAAEAMAPLAIFRDSGVMEVLAGLFAGTPFAEKLRALSERRR